MSARRIARLTLACAYAVIAVVYLAWRPTTFNGDHPVYAVAFYGAEILCIAASLVFYLLIVDRSRRPTPVLPSTLPTVDVFIATYNEDVDLLRTTATAARDMDVPHRTWLCDDGRREAVRALAEELGVGYLTRERNDHFKAGNLNNALAHTDGELVLVLDADHVPRRALLRRLIGHFDDPKVALVQTPQVYANIDSYQHAHAGGGRPWHEASVFHHLMQPGADRLDAAFFVGTGALLRRAALDEVGGFATGSITEDIHTSMRLHAAGWRSVYVDEPLGVLQAPDTAFAYACQRLRWAQGSMQILRRENPLAKPGLSATQRIGYLNSLGGYLLAFPHLLFYLAPGIFLFTGVSPIAVEPALGLPCFFGFIALSLGIYVLLAAPYGRLFLSECYKMLNMPIFLLAAPTLLKPDGLTFRVTPKGRHGGIPTVMVGPAALLCAFNTLAVGAGATILVEGTAPVPGAVALVTFFAAFFAVAGALAVLHTFARSHSEEGFAVPLDAPSTLLADGAPPRPVRIRRLNHELAYVVCDDPPPIGARCRLELAALGIERPVAVQVFAAERGGPRRGGRVLKLRLHALPAADRDLLDRHLHEVAIPALVGDHPADAPAVRRTASGRLRPVTEIIHVRSGIL